MQTCWVIPGVLFAFSNFWYKLLTTLVVTQAGTVLQCPVPSDPILVCIICSKCFLPWELSLLLPVPSPMALYGGVSSPPLHMCLVRVTLWPTHAETEQKSFTYLLLSREWPVPDGCLLLSPGPPSEGTPRTKWALRCSEWEIHICCFELLGHY